MKKILVALDFTRTSRNAFAYAVQLAKELKAELSVLHILMPITNTSLYPHIYNEYSTTNQQLNATQQLKKLMTFYPNKDSEALIKHNVPTSYQIREGLAVPNILRTAEKEGVDLIIVGTKRRTRFSNFALGSVAANLITKSEIPVLLIPEKYRYQSIKNIAIATEANQENRATTWQLRKVGHALQAKLRSFSVNQLPSDVFQKQKEEWLSNTMSADFAASTTRTTVRTKGITAGIDVYLKKHPAEVLAMFKPKRGFLQKIFHSSTTQKMVAKTNIPLLIYRN